MALAFAVLDLDRLGRRPRPGARRRARAAVVLLLLGGVLADRLRGTSCSSSPTSSAAPRRLLVAALVLTGTATIRCSSRRAVNGAGALRFPAASALTPQTVPATRLQPANALLRLGINTAMIVGAAGGGILVAAVGPGWGFAVDA